MSTNEVALDDSPAVDYSDVVINYSDIKIPENPEEIVIQKEILTFVADTIKKSTKKIRIKTIYIFILCVMIKA